jgi:hypothetical protein
VYQAGLFSAVTSAFIIQVDSQLQPNPGNETAALLRILIHKIDNTTFGSNAPTLPQWPGPPPTMVHVQAILFTSLSASLISAFLAMLGKQWINRYASTGLRGSTIKRSQSRQRKHDGIVGWYFDYVMELLPLMLQAALLLLGCALSRYLWEVSITIASVVLGFTSFGLLFYLFILVAGTAWENCPYQTPGSTLFRYLGPTVWKILRSLGPMVWRIVKSTASSFGESRTIGTIAQNARGYRPFSPGGNFAGFLRNLVDEIPPALATDARRFVQAVTRSLYAPFAITYRLVHRVHNRLRGMPPTPEQRSEHQPTVLDFRCTSWTLRTSLERPVHLSTLKYLVTITEYINFDSTVVIDCFNIFVGYVSVSNDKLVITQGLEELATLSARCLFQILRHLSPTHHSTSNVLADLRRRYNRSFPPNTELRGLPFYHAMANIRALVNDDWSPRNVQWTDYQPPDQELIPFASHMVESAWAEYQQTQNNRVPCWILRFALHFLSLDPLPPPSVVADCLTIVAIALDHDPSSVPISDERYICLVLRVPTILTKFKCTDRASLEPHYSEA